MPGENYFDYIPVELLHSLFDYFLAHELLHSFCYVSDYVDGVLRSYSKYRWNFRSIGKCNFDLVCNYSRPEQVISLVLADDKDTPGLSRLFLSRFRIEQFIQLRALTLISLDLDVSTLILSYLNQLPHLRSLSINTPIDPELLVRHRLQLTSLDICLDSTRFLSAMNLPFNDRLTRLRLEFLSQYPGMNEMARFLTNLPALKYFEILAMGSMDLFDGNRWKIVTRSLRTFNFRFSAQTRLFDDVLQSFRTAFWLQEKRWFVAYQDFSLFTVPHFTPKSIDLSQPLHIASTTPDPSFLDNYLNGIETLELTHFISFETIASSVNVNAIKHLSVKSFDDMIRYSLWKNSMPQLRQLSIKNDLTLNSIARAQHYRFDQIHQLEINIYTKQSTPIIDKLSMLFPRLEQLTYRSVVHSKETIVHSLNRFPHLTTISFLIDIWLYRREEAFCQTPTSLLQYRRVCGTRIVDTIHDHLQVHYWIEQQQQPIHSSSVMSSWYRLKRFLSSILLMSIYGLFVQYYYQIQKCSIPLMIISLSFYYYYISIAEQIID